MDLIDRLQHKAIAEKGIAAGEALDLPLMTGIDLTTSGWESGLTQEMVLDLGLVTTREDRPPCACEANGEAGRPAPRQRAERSGP